MSAPWGIALAVGCAASLDDLRRRQVANRINLTGLAAGLIYQTFHRGIAGLGWSLAGAAVGFAAFLVFYLLGGMGAGDVKLAAAFGTLLGPAGILLAALLAAPLGGLMAAVCLAWRSRTRAIPYAPALTLGAWLALLGKG